MARKNARTELLKSIDLYSTCTWAQLKRIDSLTTSHRAQAGQVLTREGDRGLEFIIVLQGTATVRRGRLPLGQIGPGSFFGELALLDHSERCATVVAETDMELLVSSVSEFRTMYLSIPPVSQKMLQVVGARLRSVDEMLGLWPDPGYSREASQPRPVGCWPAASEHAPSPSGTRSEQRRDFAGVAGRA